MLGVNPSAFRGYASGPTAPASDKLWQGVANGGVAVSYTMGKLDKLSLGGQVEVAGRQPERLGVVAFGTVGIGGVDAVVSDATARSLGSARGQRDRGQRAARPGGRACDSQIKKVIPARAGVEPLVTLVYPRGRARSRSAPPARRRRRPRHDAAPEPDARPSRPPRAGEGLPYVWGAAGPARSTAPASSQW